MPIKKGSGSGPRKVSRVAGSGDSQGPVFSGKGISGTRIPMTGYGGNGRKPFGAGSMEAWRESRLALKGPIVSTVVVKDRGGRE